MRASKVLAIDYGTRYVGIATGSTETRIAFPREVILNKSRAFLMAEVTKICKDYEIDLIVIGWPQNMNDEVETPIMKEVKKFSEELELFSHIAVELFDERLSTFEAKQMMEGFDGKRVDSQSAQIILQRFFNNYGA